METKVGNVKYDVEELQKDIAIIFAAMTRNGAMKQELQALRRTSLILDAIAGGMDVRLTKTDIRHMKYYKRKYVDERAAS